MVASLKRRGFCLPTCSRIGRGASALSMRRKLVVAVLGLVFASCFNLTERGLRGVPPGPMSWRIGYSDGCRSGRLTVLDYGYWQRDKERYRIDDLYRQGWDEAFRAMAEAGDDKLLDGDLVGTSTEALSWPEVPRRLVRTRRCGPHVPISTWFTIDLRALSPRLRRSDGA